ncbi:hypothetical protein AOLI_G00112930 [Acnodon oligacanthus]
MATRKDVDSYSFYWGTRVEGLQRSVQWLRQPFLGSAQVTAAFIELHIQAAVHPLESVPQLLQGLAYPNVPHASGSMHCIQHCSRKLRGSLTLRLGTVALHPPYLVPVPLLLSYQGCRGEEFPLR